jgi:hypothetical protein
MPGFDRQLWRCVWSRAGSGGGVGIRQFSERMGKLRLCDPSLRRTLACGFYRGYDVARADRRARQRWHNVIKSVRRVLFAPTVFAPQFLKQLDVILIANDADLGKQRPRSERTAYQYAGSWHCRAQNGVRLPRRRIDGGRAIAAVCPVTVLKKPLRIEQLYQTV